MAGAGARVERDRGGMGQGEGGRAIAGGGVVAVDGGHHIGVPGFGQRQRLPIGVSRIELIEADGLAGAAAVLQRRAVGPGQKVARLNGP